VGSVFDVTTSSYDTARTICYTHQIKKFLDILTSRQVPTTQHVRNVIRIKLKNSSIFCVSLNFKPRTLGVLLINSTAKASKIELSSLVKLAKLISIFSASPA